MIYCNGKITPKFTEEQIKKCEDCEWISGKKIWCCLFGVWIKEKPRIVRPKSRPKSRIITPDKRIRKPRSLQLDYVTAIAGHQGGNSELITEAEYILRREKRLICSDKKTCPMRGCSRWRILVEKIRKCPLKKWQAYRRNWHCRIGYAGRGNFNDSGQRIGDREQKNP